MIRQKEFVKEHKPKKVRDKIEEKRLDDVKKSNKQGATLTRTLKKQKLW